MLKIRIAAAILLIFGLAVGYFVYSTQQNPDDRFAFSLGLDLTGGSHLVYRADTSSIDPTEVEDAMATLRDVIERRVNLFGVSEPLVQVERSSLVAGSQDERLIVELPGITDVNEAIRLIGETPLLEFKLVEFVETPNEEGVQEFGVTYIDTGLTGAFLENAQLGFGGQNGGGLSNEPIILITFNNEGSELFEEITRENVGEQLAIFLDGELQSDPVIREVIAGGTATISGDFTPEEARDLVRNLNFGALPLPIELLSTQSVGASLGAEAFDRSVTAGFIGILLVGIFLMVWYRVPGIVAVASLALYIAVMLAIFKLIPVTLTAAGLAGFILSIGMAVDANVLIFERMKEQLKKGETLHDAISVGFNRAWESIRDSNISSIITAIILFWFGTSIVEGFALTFGLGVLVSMLTAITVTRTFLLAVAPKEGGKLSLFRSGF